MVPFDRERLARVMDEAGVDVVLACSRHNVRYLTGGYYYHFNAQMTRAANSQYLPFVGVPRRVENAFYVGGGGERLGLEERPLWMGRVELSGGNTVAAAEAAARLAARARDTGAGSRAGGGNGKLTVGVEMPFLPADAYEALHRALPGATFVDATGLLHELRAIKRPDEIERLRRVSEAVADAIQATFRAGRDGVTTRELSGVVEREMADHGLNFLWSFTCAGPSYLRAPSEQRWRTGRVLHLDCGGETDDYLADICRMGSLGEPSPLARELVAACLEVQDRVREVLRPGAPCREVAAAGEELMRRARVPAEGHFVAHGMGMVSHEQPVVRSQNPRPLEAGMILSVETEFLHPEVGHVKIEDTIAIAADGCVGLGDRGRAMLVVPG